VLVPLRLGLYPQDRYTLWAPSRAARPGRFLGRDGRLVAFPTPAQLAAFLRTDTDHDLARRPGVTGRDPGGFGVIELARAGRYDLAGVARYGWQLPDAPEAAALTATLEMTGRIVAAFGLTSAAAVLADIPMPVPAAPAVARFVERRRGITVRPPATELGRVLTAGWGRVLGAVEGVLVSPPVDRVALASAEWEGRGRTRPAVGPRHAAYGFWESCEIEPIAIDFGDGPLLTLRATTAFRFLGRGGRLTAFRDEEALNRWIADAGFDGHDLAGHPGWALVRERVRLGPLAAPVGDRVVHLARVEQEFAADPRLADPHGLAAAADLFRDVGRWAGDEDAAWAFRRSAVVADLIDRDPGRAQVDPDRPFDPEIALLRALVADLRSRVAVV
jgi:hypothetical protein